MVTIKDVAKEARVSIGTVSRAFNGYQDINDDTKNRIFDVADRLGYAPNVNARSLSSKNSNNMGLIVSGFLESDCRDGFVMMLLQGIYRYASKHSVEVALYTLDSRQQRSKSYERFCAEHSIFGAVLSGVATNDPYFTELVEAGMPCVLIDAYIKGARLGCVSVDNVKAADDMVQYLFDKNHRNIIVVQGKKEAEVNSYRIAGIYTAFRRNGLKLDRGQILTCNFSERQAYEKVKKYITANGKRKATAFMCLSDIMALGTMRAVRDCGYSVPEDFSVTGFDGIPIAAYTTPGLTTIEQDVVEIGYRAAALLQEIRLDFGKARSVYAPYVFKERDSVNSKAVPNNNL